MKITVFCQDGFPTRHLSADLEALLAPYPQAELFWQDLNDILGNGVRGEFFCNAHGELYPAAIEDRLYEFFCAGGGLFHLGGRPFETALVFKDGQWKPLARTLGDIRDHKGFGPLGEEIDYFRAKLGYTPYVLPYAADSLEDCEIRFDDMLVGCAPVTSGLTDQSLNLATTLQMRVLRPELDLNDHRAYQARPVVRETLLAGKMHAPDGMELLTVLQLTKAWGNPYQKDQSKGMRPWAVYSGIVEESLPEKLIDAMFRFLETPVFIKEIQLDLSSLHEGEQCAPQAVLTGQLPAGWCVCAKSAPMNADDLSEGRQPAYIKNQITYQENMASCEVSFDKNALLVAVRFELLDEAGRVRDYCESGIVCWQPDLLRDAVKITPNGSYFDIKTGDSVQESCWVSGTNWQDRHLFAFSFHNPNPLRVAGDAAEMAKTGMKFVRPHYFMPGWFRAVPGKVYEELFADFYDSFEEGPKLSERHMRALEAHVMIFGALGLCYMPSVYTSLGGKMGSPSHWMGTSRLFAVRWQIKNQKIFARQLMERFQDVPSISWDLINEPDTGMDIAGNWLSELKEIFGKTGQMVGIGCIGFIDNLLLGESADWHSLHGKTGNCYHSGKPFLLQEAHYPVPSTYPGEDELEEALNSCFANSLRDGCAGIMPWNWNMSFMNWRYRGGWVDFWDLHLGICVHPDATPRRGKSILRNWETLLSGLSFDQTKNRQVVFVYPKRCLPGKGSYEYLDLLRDERIKYCAVNDADLCNFDLSETKIIIFPLYGLGYRRSSYDAALAFAKNGGVVFSHNENMLLDEDGNADFSRNIPEKAGRIAIGKGVIEWCLGWNIDANYGCLYPDIVTLKGILKGLELKKNPPGEKALTDGKIVFKERFVRGRTSMLYDWGSREPWPDADMVVKAEIKGQDERVRRAWLRGGETVCVDGVSFTSYQDLFFIRESCGKYYIAGGDIMINGMLPHQKARLVTPYTTHGAWEDTGMFLDGQAIADGICYRMQGWQRMYWLEVTK